MLAEDRYKVSDMWPFEDARNVAVITTRQVVHGAAPILWVSHDEDDGSWQFHTGELVEVEDAMVVGLEEIVERDPTVFELADLPVGWVAWRRAPGEPWERKTHRQTV